MFCNNASTLYTLQLSGVPRLDIQSRFRFFALAYRPMFIYRKVSRYTPLCRGKPTKLGKPWGVKKGGIATHSAL